MPARRRRAAALLGATSTPARRCSGCSRTPRRSSRACPSTRRSSTSAACGRIAGTPVEIATGLRREVLGEVGLPITVGVARTKFLAKVASGVAKPDGLLEVPPDRELAFLHPLPVERLWGVGPATAAKLHDRGIATVGEVAVLGEGPLVAMLGPAAGRQLHALAHNRDPRPVEVGRRRRSVGSQRAMGRGPHTAEDIDASLVALADRVTRRLRKGAADRADGRAAAALRRLHHGPPGRTRWPSRPRRRRWCWPPSGPCSPPPRR